EDQQIAHHVLADEVQRQQRVAQVIEDAHEQHDVEPLAQARNVVDRKAAQLDVHATHLRSETRLREAILVEIDGDHASRAATLHFDGVEAAAAPDVEYATAGDAIADGGSEARPFDRGIIAERMVRRGLYAIEIDIVEPGAERLDSPADFGAAWAGLDGPKRAQHGSPHHRAIKRAWLFPACSHLRGRAALILLGLDVCKQAQGRAIAFQRANIGVRGSDLDTAG